MDAVAASLRKYDHSLLASNFPGLLDEPHQLPFPRLHSQGDLRSASELANKCVRDIHYSHVQRNPIDVAVGSTRPLRFASLWW